MPPPPIILTNVSCAESRDEAHERAMRYLGRKWDSIDNHYHFSDGHLATVKGYEAYGKMTKTYAKMKEEAARQKATEFYVKIQIVGTPDDCIQQIAELRALTGTDHMIADFSYGGMPHEEGELNMRLFADRVVPVLQRDALFAAPPAKDASRPRTRTCSLRHNAHMHRRWLILAVLFVARTAMGFRYQTVASTAPLLLRELHVGFAEIGTLIGLYHISGVFSRCRAD